MAQDKNKPNKNLTYLTADAASADPSFAVQGEFVSAVDPKAPAMQVIAMGGTDFQVVLYDGGLPGAGWDGEKPTRLDMDDSGVFELMQKHGMNRVYRTSETLGAKPPKGAVVLFDGSAESVARHWKEGAKHSNGLLHQGCTSKDKFQSFKLHIEFQTPFKPFARGQGRGNSGVYYQGRYETQVLDSFGLEGRVNETGGIYSIKAPDLNMCLPPLSWQTYDADFVAAKYDTDGKKTKDATLTVRLNGVLVHKDVKLGHKTTAAPVAEGPEPGPIYIQNHSNPVRFRNIWVLPQ